MTPGQANEDIERAAALPGAAASSRTPVLQRKWVRGAIVAGIALASFAATLIVAYELALARVPQHRAALERLVRAHTGLDVRFNELGLRWGWYGPEAVFRRVELGEPGRSNVLLRAPQLIVGLDTWRTLQTGQLAAGRITLVAPDIDLERLAGPRPRSADAVASSAEANTNVDRARILERWRGGRIDLQGGTLRLPGPAGSANSLTLHIRRASLRRSDDEWNGFGLVFLPERMGRTARLAVQLQGDLSRPESLSGALRFEGWRLAFAGWRDVLSGAPRLARSVPSSGDGDVHLNLTLKDGRIEKADGQVRASGVTLGAPPWADASSAAAVPHDVLRLDYLAGDWRFVRRAGGGHLQIEQLVLSREDKDSPLPRISVEIGGNHTRGGVARAPLHSAAAIARWLAPELIPPGIVLKGSAENIDFDWNAARPEGERLAASALVNDASVASDSGGFVLSGLRTRLEGSESRVAIELDSPAARLEMQAVPEQPFEGMKVASVLEINRTGAGWKLATRRLIVAHDIGQLVLSGSLVGNASGDVPVLDARGTVTHADVAKLQQLLAATVTRAFGPAATRLSAGRIEEAKFELQGPVGALFAQTDDAPSNGASTFKGSLTLRGARVAAQGPWPEAEALDAKLEWNGPRIRASIDEGSAGAFQLDAVEAQWDASGARAAHVTGRARARLEQALAWIRAHPELQEYAPHLEDLVARGDALFDFDISIPAETALAPRATPPQTQARIATVLEGVQFRLAPELPPVESLRGSLDFDSGRLRRSTLSAIWLGGPLTLKVSERRDWRGNSMAVQAQGFIDARKLVALSRIRNLPEVSGQTPWSGEFLYTSPNDTQPASWQGRADSNLVGIASELPAPFAKLAGASMPLHFEIAGSGDKSDVHANLAERVKTAFSLRLRDGSDWQIEHGAVQVGAGAAALNATFHSEQVSAGTEVRIESRSLGVLTGTLAADTPDVVVRDLRLVREAMTGEGSIHCGAGLATCEGQFELTTNDTAATLADLGFRPELSAAKGSLSGEVSWQPRAERPWLEAATGRLSMRFDDGVARNPDDTSGRPFPLLTVPALLSGIARPPAVPPGELRFKRLAAEFQLRDGQAFTSDLHFDGDAEILVRGRTGLLAHDYDHEAWVLRGEERIPASLRRLVATPRVAAAWMTLRELIRGDAADRSRVVLHLRGSWSEPVVSVD
jgi:uncharacterized protein YhdP